MALNQPRRWLIAYDLRDNRRIARVHRLLTRVAVPVQYSMFAAIGSALAMRQLAHQIQGLIDGKVDDVRMYPIPAQPLVHSFGRAMLPDDAALLDARGEVHVLLGAGSTVSRGDPVPSAGTSAGEARPIPATPSPSRRHEKQNRAEQPEPQP